MACSSAGHCCRFAGLSLVELLVSMALGVTLSFALVSVYLHGSRLAAAEGEFARMRESARYAGTLLRRELTLAGLFGADPGQSLPAASAVAVDCLVGDWALDARLPLDMITDAAQPLRSAAGDLLTCLGAVNARRGVLPGTDVIAIKRTAADATVEDGRYFPGEHGAQATQWYLRSEAGGGQSWVYVGEDGHFPAASAVAGNGVSLREYYARLYYVRAWSQRPGDGLPSLCVEQLAGNRMSSECLVEGVEDLQLELALDTDGDGIADRVTANPTAADLARAVRAHYFLLLRSIGPVDGAARPTLFKLGTKVVSRSGDQYHRRVISGVVRLRNIAPLGSG